MKAKENILAKITVISLSVLYLFVALTYVLFLPNYNDQRAGSKHVSYNHTVLLPAKKYIGYNSDKTPLLEKVFKTTVEHKKGVLVALLPAALVATSAAIAAGFSIRKGAQLAYVGSRRHTYLQVRSLRI